MSDLAQRYALAAIEAASSPREREQLVVELEQLAPHVGRTSHLYQRLTGPKDAEDAKAAQAQLFAALKLSGPMVGLLQVLLRNRRLGLLGDIARAARREVDVRAGAQRAYVRSATELNQTQKERLEQTLSTRLGMPVVAHVIVDAGLRAGLICRIGSVTIDSSLKSQLRRVARQLA